MKKFDFERWFGVIDEHNRADDYYADDEAYMYCDECDNLMVPTGGGYKCPVCGAKKAVCYHKIKYLSHAKRPNLSFIGVQ